MFKSLSHAHTLQVRPDQIPESVLHLVIWPHSNGVLGEKWEFITTWAVWLPSYFLTWLQQVPARCVASSVLPVCILMWLFFFSFSKRKKIVLNITQCSGSFQSFITNTSADKCNTPFPAYIRTYTQIYKHLNTHTHTHTHILPNQLWAGPHKWISRNPKPSESQPLLPCPSHHHCGILP